MGDASPTPPTESASSAHDSRPADGGRFMEVSRARAMTIARRRVASQLIECDVSEAAPQINGYCVPPLPLDCWYVRCMPAVLRLGGTSLVVCVCKRTGRVRAVVTDQSE
jgi:hypothetical protein